MRLRGADAATVGGTGMVPEYARYTSDGVWCVVQDALVTIGVTEYALKHVGAIIYVDLPDVGEDVLQEIPCFEIEGDRNTVEFRVPFDGEVAEINTRAAHDPELVADDPYIEGWLLKLRAEATVDADTLLSPREYEAQAKRRRR
jgi:glycine cleavage system H protein